MTRVRSNKLLLTGAPGTGKTHLREVLVAEHGAELLEEIGV